ncbi:hypothetical protein DITRI_Ditri02bG0166700 [Diplodiscus trichospermus]
MPKPQLPLFCLIAAVALFLIPQACNARSRNNDCGFTFCGKVNISFPFRLTTQPRRCNDHRFELECDSNNRTSLALKHGRLYVKTISYEHQTIQFLDADLGRDNCSLPRNSLSFSDSTTHPYSLSLMSPLTIMYLVNCTTPMKSPLFSDASRCPTTSINTPASYFYSLDVRTSPLSFDQSCTIKALVPVSLENISYQTTSDIYENLLLGFELQWNFYSGQENRPFQAMMSSLLYALQSYADSFLHFLFNGPM